MSMTFILNDTQCTLVMSYSMISHEFWYTEKKRTFWNTSFLTVKCLQNNCDESIGTTEQLFFDAFSSLIHPSILLNQHFYFVSYL